MTADRDGADAVLAEGGDLAGDLAAVDWSATPLGPPAAWPAEVRSVLRLMSGSRFPMWFAWGPDLTLLYNAAHARETLRGKHPWALGRPAPEVWADVWEDVAPQVRAVLDRGESTWNQDLPLHLDRGGWTEETHYTFSYSPVLADDGVVRGIFCVATATSDRVRAGRRMTFLRDLMAATGGSRTPAEVARSLATALGGDRSDLPAGLLYLAGAGADGHTADLVTDVGLGPAPVVPRRLAVDEGHADWPVARAAMLVELPLPAAARAGFPPRCDRVVLVPLDAGGGTAGRPGLGVLVLGLSRHLEFDDDYRDFVHLVATHVASAVLDARAVESDRRRSEALAELDRVRSRATESLVVVQRVTAALSAAATPIAVARAIVDGVGDLLGGTVDSAVFELDPEAQELRVLARHPRERDARSTGDVVPLGRDTLLTRAVRDRRPVRVREPGPEEPDAGQDPTLVALLRARGLRAVFSVPLLADDRVVGALAVGGQDPSALDEAERAAILALSEPGGPALERARLYRTEHDIAETLQRALLPQGLPRVARLPIAVRYLPGAVGTSAGGDWYDVVEVGPHQVAVVVGDVVGQGTAAAAVMGQLRTALSGYLLAGHGPGPALDLLDGLVARVPGARASTAICLLVDTDTGDVRWARAGHLPALLVDAAGPRLLTDAAGHGPLLGLAPESRTARTEGRITIAAGDDLVLYTDGLVERRGESLDEGLGRLVEVAAASGDTAPEPMASYLLGSLAPAEAIDDVAVVVVRLAPSPLTRTFPADPAELARMRRAVRAWAGPAGLREEVAEDLQLALGEAATNAVEHAYGLVPPAGAEVTVALAAQPDGGVAVDVTDRGAWREIPIAPGHRGRGLALIRALAPDVVVDAGSRGTTVSFTVPPARRSSGGEPGTVPPDAAPDREVSVTVDGTTVRVTGDLDLAGAGTLARVVAAPPAEAWSLDVTAVGHLASAGIGVLLAAAEAGASLVLPDVGPAARVLALSGLVPASPVAARP